MHEIEWEEGRHIETLEDMEKDCFWMIDILRKAATCEFSTHYSKDIPRFVEFLNKLAERCREERASLGMWREDEREPEEIIKELDDEFGVITTLMKAKIFPSFPKCFGDASGSGEAVLRGA